MDNLADLANALFIHAMGRWIGRHQTRQALAGRLRLSLEVVEINVAGLVALDDHHLHASHLR
ncbi:hypothetical protein D3C77_773240 [compost metagenome]